MHALSLIDLAAVFIHAAESQRRLRIPYPKRAAHSYWLNCRYRHDIWTEKLSRHRRAIQKSGASLRKQLWYDILPTIQEVLLSEPLTRCIAHQACVMEELRIDTDFGALAHSAWTTHVEARHRCLHLIVFGNGLSTDHAVHLNQLRKSCETYNDQLLATLRAVDLGEDYAFDSPSTNELRRNLTAHGLDDSALKLHTSSLVNWFIRRSALDLDYRTGNVRETVRVAETVLSLLPSEIFDSFGLPLSLHAANIKSGILATDSDQAPAFTIPTAKYFSPLDILNKSAIRDIARVTPKRW